MCYAIPGKVVGFRKNIAIIDYFGEKKSALNEFEAIKIGDYVYAQGGVVIDKITEQEALPILEAWKDRFLELKRIDLKISHTKKTKSRQNDFAKIIEKAEQGLALEKREILRLLKTKSKEELDLLFKTANRMRQKYLKNSCCVHGIIEFSNYCRNDCLYCGIRKGNCGLRRYRMSIDEIVDLAEHAVKKLGFRALVLQSGEDLWYTAEKLVDAIKRIKKKCGVLLFVSVGSRSFDDYKKMHKAGARGVLLRFESSNPSIYKKIHSGTKSDFKKRICLLQ